MADQQRTMGDRGTAGDINLRAMLDRAPRSPMAGCAFHDIRERLRKVGLRPTRQRLMLGWLLFAKGHRHVSAEMLYEEATRAKAAVSLATVYNTLHQFTEAGLLKQLALDGTKSYFDTNVSDHNHYFIEDEQELVDIPPGELDVKVVPNLPPHFELRDVEVIVRVRRRDRLAMARTSGEA
ncbi:transcriptional repressor [Chelatococcus composti]|jgi:Fur family iron response transcriptional regulator|uniref:Ferric uptake regulation protein n=2 Tax=Chelatococcus composti TaxID=1743235 RepID=A0A841KFL7_9HYPH|nr:Fur family iron response transcriptional regulator [Chelatococcus composti]PZN46342.1 MAG: transcriptional repressor [Pseudomonadota bacterium]GGG49781.1 transcriptional repressor [Chelatococcus composti]